MGTVTVHTVPVADEALLADWTRFYRGLAVVLTLSFVVRLCLLGWFRHEPLHIVDEQHYNQLAVQLAQTGDFAFEPGELTSLRPPLYPFLVSLIYRVAGIENYQAVRLVQLFLGLATAAMCGVMATRMYDERVGIAAASIAAFYPSLLGSSNLVLTEVLFAFWVVLACLILQQFYRSNRLRYLVAMGIVLALGALTRSVLWLFPPFLVVYLLYCTQGKTSRRLAVAFIPVLAFVLTIAPWAARNTKLQRTFTTIDVMGGRNFMMGNYEYTPLFRAWDAIAITGEQAWYAVLERAYPVEYPPLTQGQKDKVALRYGLGFAMQHPGLTSRRCLVKFVNFWQLERSLVAGLVQGWWGDLSKPMIGLMALVIVGSYAVAMLGGIFGLLVRPPGDLRLAGFMLLLTTFVWAVHTAVFAHARYHVSLMPMLLIFTASGLMNISQIWQKRGSMAFKFACILTAFLVASWCWEVIFVELPLRRATMG